MEEWEAPLAEVERWITAQLTLRRVRGRRVPHRVREFVAAVLADRRLDGDTVWKAVEIVNELVINVALYAPHARAVVRVSVRTGRLALTVQDTGPGSIRWPRAMAALDAEGGRGLPMIGLLADRVQLFDVSPVGKAVTALIDL